MDTPNRPQAAPAQSGTKPARTKSKEVVLKQEMKRLRKEMDKVEKMIVDHDNMAKEVTGAKDRKANIKTKLETIKKELIKVMGLE